MQNNLLPWLVWTAAMLVALGCGSDDDTSAPNNGADDTGLPGDGGSSDTEELSTMDTAPATGPVITSERWEVVVEPSGDPFAALRPEDAECDPEGYQVEPLAEEIVFSIDTWNCNYVTIRQPILRTLHAGDQLEGRIWHFDLTAPGPGDAYVAYSLDGEIVWESDVRIPSSSGLILPAWEMTRTIPEGTSIYFHLNNHGSNSWSVIDLLVVP